MLVYADASDLSAWIVGIPGLPSYTDPAGMLRSASILVAQAVNESLYDPGVVTSDPKRDATCAQVVSWLTTGINPGTGGLSQTATVKSKTIADGSIEYDTSLSASVTAFQARADIANGLCAEALAILTAAQILWAPLPIWSDCPDQGVYVSEFGVVGGNEGFSGVFY